MGKIFKFAIALFLIGAGCVAVFSIISEEPIFGTFGSDEDYELQELTYDADDFTGFDFLLSNRDVIIEESEDDQIKVVYYTSEKDDIIVSDDGSELSLQKDIEWFTNWFSGWGTFFNDEIFDLYLYIPTTVDYDISIYTSNGTLTMTDLDNIKDFVFDTSNGRLTLENVSADDINLDTSNGGCYLTDVTVVNDLTMDSSNGKIMLTNIVADSIKGDTSNGRITATNLVSDDIDLDTSNGSISVTISGNKDDYEVDVDTSNGDIDWDGLGVTDGIINEDAPKKLRLHTSNGDIDIIFS